MDDKRMPGPRWFAWLLIAMLAFMVGNTWAAVLACTSSLQVWVQPSGDTFSNAYALQAESRTYFGRVEGGSGNYVYKWEFSDGSGSDLSSGWPAVGNPNYINYDGQAFANFGSQWAKLTVQDASNPCDTVAAQVNLQVIAATNDSPLRQKSSAIDRGLRWQYQQMQYSGSDAYWADGYGSIAATGLALIALENQGHNLQSNPDTDIYQKSVRQGVQWLLKNSSLQTVNIQGCIGDPETAASGDTMVDGLGLMFENNGYADPIATLALVNSASKVYAQNSYIVSGTGVTGTDKFGNAVSLDGMSLYQAAIEAKDWITWAQGDGAGGTTTHCDTSANGYPYGWFDVTSNNGGVTDIKGYMWNNYAVEPGGSFGQFNINWGDGTSSAYTNVDEHGWSTNYNEPELSYYAAGPTHGYTTAGGHTISFSYTGNDGVTTTNFCSVDVTTSPGFACGSNDAPNAAWRYSANYGDSDNSAAQWDVLALAESLNRWNIDVNPYVKNMVDLWLNYSACDQTGVYGGGTYVGPGYGFGYTGPNYWCNYQKSAAGLIMMNYTSRLATDPMVVNDLAFLGNNWNTSGSSDWNFDNHYAMYAMYKALKSWNLTTITDGASVVHNWEAEYDADLINRQNGDGSWGDEGWFQSTNQTSSAALAILAPGVASLPPVAVATATPSITSAGTPVALDGSQSYDQDSSKHITKYEWDFDASDSLWWNGNVSPPAGQGATGPQATVTYPDLGHDQDYTVTLRVSDSTQPTPLQSTGTTVVHVRSGEVAPVAKTNGPWTALPNTPITFDGTASYDPNDPAHCSGASCAINNGTPDHIVSYAWDLNGDGIYGGADDGVCVAGTNCAKVQKAYPQPVSLPASLKVCDTYGNCSTSNNNLNVVSIALVYGQNYQTCWRKTLDRFTDQIGMAVVFKNQGSAEADDVHMTLTGVPSNMTILSGGTSLGTMLAGQSVVSACDPLHQTADIKMQVNKKINGTGNWTWRAQFNFQGNPYTVDNIPPLGP